MDLIGKVRDVEFRKKIANRLFYIALFIELILMIAEKSELTITFESYVFRVTFLITLLAVLIMHHNPKEWFMIGCVWVFTFACYRLTGRNELLRYATFVMAAANINLGRTMKVMFKICCAGFGIIALLSITGVMGNVYTVMDYGRDAGVEQRFVFGFGHPNTLWGCVYMLLLLWLWLYGSKAKIWHFMVLSVLEVGVSVITSSRTGLMIGAFTIIMAVLIRYIPAIKSRKYLYFLASFITPVLCVVFSIWSACISYIPRYEKSVKFYKQIEWLDELLNNRIQNLYRENDHHAGSIGTWKLFSDRISEEYFDMGWVRLFYWYGIIPTVIICIIVATFIYLCYKRRDAWTLLLIVSLSIYTVIEATFVSVYIGRNILLPILGVYIAGFSLKSMRNSKHGSHGDL